MVVTDGPAPLIAVTASPTVSSKQKSRHPWRQSPNIQFLLNFPVILSEAA
jgi:hypothetical protein